MKQLCKYIELRRTNFNWNYYHCNRPANEDCKWKGEYNDRECELVEIHEFVGIDLEGKVDENKK